MKFVSASFSFLLFSLLVACSSPAPETPKDDPNAEFKPAENKSVSANSDLSPADYQAALGSTPGTLLDVRTPEEFAEGHLPGAININVNGDNFLAEATKLDKSKPLYVYCLKGSRSANAKQQLIQDGFTNVINMTGGIEKWIAEGKPVVQ